MIPDIKRFLQPSSHSSKVSLELNASHVSKAVTTFVDIKVQRLATIKQYDSKTQLEVQQQLRDKAEGTFLWVSLVCKELEGVPLYYTRQVLRELPLKLDPLYDRMIKQILAQDVKTAEYCKNILRSVTCAYRLIRQEEIAVVASLPKNQIRHAQEVADLISRCGSFLTVREGTVLFVHLSAKDYFTSGQGQQVFKSAETEQQGQMVHCLIDAMHRTLRRDICGLQNPGARVQDANDSIKNSTLPQIAYACEYWIYHLCACPQDDEYFLLDGSNIHCFLQKQLLHWLEAMSLLKKIPEALAAIQKLHSKLIVSG